jgi:hypothetical protein
MTVLRLDQSSAPAIRAAMTRFEESFTYPLGAAMRFSISHGDDYCRFYSSMGDSATFVIERQGAVLGTVSLAVRDVSLAGRRVRSAYVGDLKLLPEARKGFSLLRLAGAAEAWVRTTHGEVDSAFAVVMDGTEFTPDVYTGRAGIPALAAVGHLSVFCLNLTAASTDQAPVSQVKVTAGVDKFAAAFAALSQGSRVIESGDATMRSRMVPLHLVAEDGAACGCLEDTYEAKKLLLNSGGFFKAAHLARFAFASPQAGLDLVRTALSEAQGRGYEYLFFGVDTSLAPAFEQELGRSLNGSVGGATIFASEKLAATNSSSPWIMSTSEV